MKRITVVFIELLKLVDLKERGLLTEEEFKAAVSFC